MASTLTDFLISIKYTVDAASQNNFLAGLKHVLGSVNQVAAGVVGLNAGIIALGKAFAETGEKFYFMSSRFGSGVSDIKESAFAMSQLGLSTEQAQGQMESFGRWTRSMGPAATMFLRSLGVTARDTVGQMDQLGDALRRMGGTKENAQGSDAQRRQYAIALQYAQMAGLDEQGMLAQTDKDRDKNRRRAGFIQQRVWGVETKEEVAAAEQKWADTSHKVMGQFREFGVTFQAMRSRFGESLMEKLLPVLEKFQRMLLDNMPAITTWLDRAAHGMAAFVEACGTAIEVFTKLPGVMQATLAILLAWRPAMSLLASPMGRLITMLGALMLLFEDWSGYHEGKGAAIDWGQIEDFVEPFMKIGTEINDWVSETTGIDKSFTGIALSVAGILTSFIGIKNLGGIWKLLFGGGKPPVPVPGAAGGAGGLATWLLPIATLIYSMFEAGQNQSANQAEQEKLKAPRARRAALLDAIINGGVGGTMTAEQHKQLEDINKEIATIRKQPASIAIETPEEAVAAERKRRLRSGDLRSATPAEVLQHYGIDDPEVEKEHKEGAKTFWEKTLEFLKDAAANSNQQMSQRSGTGNMFAGPGASGFAGDMRTVEGFAGAALRQQFGEGSIEGIGGGGPGSGGNIDRGASAAMLSQYFQSQGWTKEQSAGIIANLIKESGLNPHGPAGDNGLAQGIAQWHPDRQARFLKVMGKRVQEASLMEQAQFVQWELTHSEAAAGRALRGAKTAYQAGGAISRYYERPRDTYREMEGRGQQAEWLMPKLKTYTQTPALGADGAPPGAAGAALRGQAEKRLNQNNNTNIRIEHGPTAVETAKRVADALPREHERFIRMAEGRLLA